MAGVGYGRPWIDQWHPGPSKGFSWGVGWRGKGGEGGGGERSNNQPPLTWWYPVHCRSYASQHKLGSCVQQPPKLDAMLSDVLLCKCSVVAS